MSDRIPSEDRVRVSVVIPTFNGAATLREQLDALLAQSFGEPFEILVADNGSTDASREIVAGYAAKWPEVRLVDASAARGVNAARNAGALAARGEKLLFCDSDDVAAAGWIAGLARALDEADGAGGVLEFERLNPHLAGRPPMPAVAREGGAAVPVGACSAWRRSFLESIGGFDPSWRDGCDDVETAIRAAQAGARIVEAPEAVMHKRARASRKALFRQYYKYGWSRPRLIRRFPDYAENRGAVAAAKDWLRLLARLARGDAQYDVVARLGKNCGRLIGSLKHGVWAP